MRMANGVQAGDGAADAAAAKTRSGGFLYFNHGRRHQRYIAGVSPARVPSLLVAYIGHHDLFQGVYRREGGGAYFARFKDDLKGMHRRPLPGRHFTAGNEHGRGGEIKCVFCENGVAGVQCQLVRIQAGQYAVGIREDAGNDVVAPRHGDPEFAGAIERGGNDHGFMRPGGGAGLFQQFTDLERGNGVFYLCGAQFIVGVGVDDPEAVFHFVGVSTAGQGAAKVQSSVKREFRHIGGIALRIKL